MDGKTSQGWLETPVVVRFLLLAVVIALLVMPAVWWLLEAERRAADAELAREADNARAELNQRLAQQASALAAMTAYFEAGEVVDAARFRQFAERLMDGQSHIRSMHYHQYVSAAQRPRFEGAVRALGEPEFRIREITPEGGTIAAGSRDYYLPVVFIAPETERSRELIGLDLLQQPAARNLVLSLRENHIAAGPGPIPMRDGDAGYFIFRAVGENAFVPTGGEAGGGVLSIASHPGQLLPIARLRAAGIDVWLQSPGGPPESPPEVDATSAFPFGLQTIERSVRLGDQQVRLILERQRGWREVLGHPGLLLLLLLGLAVSFAAAAAARHYARQLQFSETLRERWHDYRERGAITLAAMADAVVVTDAAGRVDYMNPMAEKMTGWVLEDARDRPLGEILHLLAEPDRRPLPGPLRACLASGAPVASGDHDAILVHNDGTEFLVRYSAAPIRDRHGNVSGATMLVHDLSQQRRMASQLAYRDKHDPVTGLINRDEFERALQTVSRESSPDEEHALLMIAVDDFSELRDRLGVSAGNELLQQTADLLRTRLRTGDVLASPAEGEFALVLRNCSATDAGAVADNLLKVLREYRYSREDEQHRVTLSIGVVGVHAGDVVTQVLSAGEQAVLAARERGGDDWEHEAKPGGGVAGRHGELDWVQRIHEALEEERFVLAGQPVVDIADAQQVRQIEIRLGMCDEHGAEHPAASFLPVAERHRLGAAIDRWVLPRALRAFSAQSKSGTILAVNVSAQSLTDEDFVRFVRQSLTDNGVRASRLRLELREVQTAYRVGTLVRVLQALRHTGVSFCLDDFGIGAAGFAALRLLRPDAIKIHADLLQAALVDPAERAVAEAICHVAAAHGSEVGATGVDTRELFDLAGALPLDHAQGDYLAPTEPMAVPAVVAAGRR